MFKLPKNTTIIFFRIILAVMFFASTFFYSNLSYAAVSLPWSTTYNCADWTQGTTLSCDGLSTYGGWFTSSGSKEQITASANYSGGAGGKGQRHWVGDGYTNSGGLQITFPSAQTEIWMRWYMRVETGFIWNYLKEYKMLYFDAASTLRLIVGYDGYDTNRVMIDYNGNGYSSTVGWDTDMANGGDWVTTNANGATPGETHKKSDGQWHFYEVHLKTDTNGNNGVVQMWVDGVSRINRTNANYGQLPMNFVLVGSNATYPLNGRDMYIDYDDIAINNTGYIGPISGADSTAPTQPTNLSATVQSATQINLTWATSTDNVGVAGYNIYRDGVQIATSTTTSYSNTGLTASTAYSYTISAYDAANNESTQSASIQTTTLSIVLALKGDFNSDKKVNDLDFTSFKNAFKSIFNSIFDLNSDSAIDVKDLGVLMSGWLE